MINYLKIKNFKIHKEMEIRLLPLTLLAGTNGSGKSSIIQALLLLRQSMINDQITNLKLSGSLCNIGFRQDALCMLADDDEIAFTVNDSNWTFAVDTHEVGKNSLPIINEISPAEASRLHLFGNGFQYISAYRQGPQNSYSSDTNLVDSQRQISIQNGKCENIAYFLYHFGIENDTRVPESLRNPTCNSSSLLDQVSAWEGQISAGIRVKPSLQGQEYSLRYSFDNIIADNGALDVVSKQEYLPTNVGFGVSYSLPIVAALLTAQPDDLIIVENPEAHLHESGQVALAHLISMAAQSGIQVIIETHSSHILEGILIDTKEFEQGKPGIDKSNVSLAFFCKDPSTQVSKVECPRIVGDAKLDFEPIGFFDQSAKNLEQIMGF